MDQQKYSVLLVEDDRVDQLAFKRFVDRESLNFDYEIVSSFREAKKLLTTKHFDVVITDYYLGDGTAFDVFEYISDSSIIITTGTGDEEVAVKAMKFGAYDYLIKDPDRKYLTMLPVTVENALKQKRAEEYQKRLLLLDSAVMHAFDAVIIAQADLSNPEHSTIVLVNEAFLKMTGYSENEVIGKSVNFLYGPKTDITIVKKIEKAIAENCEITSEIIYYKKDGSQFWVEFSLQPVLSGKGDLKHWIYVQRDISERKSTEEKLRQYNERLDIILQSMGDGVLVIDADLKIMLMNNKARELLGINQEDESKLTFEEIIHNCSEQGEKLFESLNKKSFANLEFQVRHPKPRILLITGTSFLDIDGKSAGKVLVLRDYTKEKEIEQMKNDFVSNVSHELRTPLASILGFSSTILKDKTMPSEITQEFIEIIYRESRRLAQLIDDILSISRIESGRQLYIPKKVDLKTIVPEVVDTFKIQALEKQIQLIDQVNGNIYPILVDQKAFRQVLVNLIGNAIKFTEPNGTVTISAKNGKNLVELVVTDNGIGIPEAEIDKIFEKFYRVNRHASSISGTGLGLSIVKEIVHSHNGKIFVESKENQGSTFRVSFPKFEDVK